MYQHKPIQIKALDLVFSHKTCFEDFSCQVSFGSRVAIIGRNGSGKSTLLKIIANVVEPSGGAVITPTGCVIGYVPQMIEDHSTLSGGLRFNKKMAEVLHSSPDILLLDEPSNHLDQHNRQELFRQLQAYSGTLLIVSHDVELIRGCTDTLWHIDHGKVHVFSGGYDVYWRELELNRRTIEHEIVRLNQQKKEIHEKLMKEQQRVSKAKLSGEKKLANRQLTKMAANTKKMAAEKYQGKKTKEIDHTKQTLISRLSDIRLPEIIVPTFSIHPDSTNQQTVVQIVNGSVGYQKDIPILDRLYLRVGSGERVIVVGDNGSGKTTLVNAIRGMCFLHKTGEWFLPKPEDVGYLDQHYNTLNLTESVIEQLKKQVPHWSHAQLRKHLNDFLFRKNEEVEMKVSHLSGGERVRLILAQIAAKPPKLLILDEVSNNLDIESKSHVIQVLREYTGAMMLISHDTHFSAQIEFDQCIDVKRYLFST
jgi:ATPase subunit of ABC transporter with duplicated ATPase domains